MLQEGRLLVAFVTDLHGLVLFSDDVFFSVALIEG